MSRPAEVRQPEISVIVPVYNVEKYLGRCVDSILAQTFRDLEILLVDDGATDRSGEMCDGYAAQDDRIRVIHKENGGLSDARNAGIDAAGGRFLCFIDSDDFIDPTMLEVLHRLIVQEDAEVAICGICDCYEGGRTVQTEQVEEFTCTGVEAMGLTLEGVRLPGSVCSKLIRAELCRTHRFRRGKTYEDAFFMPGLLIPARKVAATTASLYSYWHRAGSITTQPFSQRNMDVVEAYQYTLDEVQKSCPELLEAARFRLFWANFVVLDKMLVTENYRSLPQFRPVLRFLRSHWLEIVRNPYFRRSRRIAAVALRLQTGLYRRLVLARDSGAKVNE